MFDGVVEQPHFALNPGARVIAHAKAATLRHDQRQVSDKAGVDHTRVRRNPGAGLEPGKQHARTALAGKHQRHPLYRGCGFRAQGLIIGERLAVAPEIKSAPVAVIGHAVIVVGRPVCAGRKVGAERGVAFEQGA